MLGRMPETKAYVGTKLVRVYPQTKDGRAGYTILYPDGYESWSPKESFDGAYREVTQMEKALVGLG